MINCRVAYSFIYFFNISKKSERFAIESLISKNRYIVLKVNFIKNTKLRPKGNHMRRLYVVTGR